MTRLRRLGKVQMLAQAAEEHPLHGGTGIATYPLGDPR